MHHRPVKAYVDLNALKHNLQIVKKRAPNSKVIAVIKANGYGHGIGRVAHQLTQADAFGVASIDEALQLRQKGFLHRILLLEGLFSEIELPIAVQNRFDLVVHSFHQVDWLENYARNIHNLNIWVKIDSGMHRLGFAPDELEDVVDRLSNFSQFNLYFMTHFSCADESSEHAVATSEKQFAIFSGLTNFHTGMKSSANSAAIFNLEKSHLDWIRPGICLYGCGFPEIKNKHQLKPVMRLESNILTLKWIPKGDSVGYGQTWTAERDTLLAVVAIGYGDGYPRSVPSGTPVLIHGQRMPIVGRVSMDMITVDVTDIAKQVNIDDPVILWGDRQLSVDEIAEAAGTISYELLCGITARVPMIEVR